MNKDSFLFRLLTMLSALLLIVSAYLHYHDLKRNLADILSAGEISRQTWQRISDEKEALQADLTEVTNALKEARLTITEKEERKQTLTAEIEQLKQ